MRRRRLLAGGAAAVVLAGGAVAYSVASGSDDPSLSEEERLRSQKTASAAVDLATLDVELERCDLEGAVGQVVNTGGDDAVVRLVVDFRTGDGDPIHQAGNEALAVAAGGDTSFEVPVLAALVPEGARDEPLSCAASILPVDAGDS